MRAYWTYIQLRFKMGLQYRAAAYAGIATQFAWGAMYIMLYYTFYESKPSAAPLEFDQLASYIWLQQAFLALFMTWLLDAELLTLITSGNVAYELCRPVDLYRLWFAKNVAVRLSKAALRFGPILVIAALLPAPYGFIFPRSLADAALFLISMVLAFFVVIAYTMFIYILSFHTISATGVRIIFIIVAEFFSGSYVPLPLFPDWLEAYVRWTPFAAMQNAPFLIYSGHFAGSEAWTTIALQIFWLVVMVAFGRFLLRRVMARLVVQGG